MTENKVRCVYPRLQLAYLLQFAIWGSWCVALGGYLTGKMSGPHIGTLYMAIPLGAIIAPMFIGPIADRYFSAQKVLGLLHLISGAALVACGIICAQAESPGARRGGCSSIWIVDGFDAHLRPLFHAVHPINQYRRLQAYPRLGFGAQGLYLWNGGLDLGQFGRGSVRRWRRQS